MKSPAALTAGVVEVPAKLQRKNPSTVALTVVFRSPLLLVLTVFTVV